jgi:cobalamin biosynthesis protein CobT
MNNIIQNTIEQIAEFLVKQKGLFAKKMTKAKLMAILNSAPKEDDVVANCPEGWEEKKWKEFEKKMGDLEGDELLNVVTHKVNNGKKKSQFVINEALRLCAPKDEEEKLDVVVSFLNGSEKEESEDEKEESEESGEEKEESEESGEEKEESEEEKEESEEEESNDFIEGFDEKKLSSLKKAIKKLAKDEFLNLTTLKKVGKSAANEKKMVFDAKMKLAIPKLANEKEQKEYNNRVKKMIAE